MRQDKTGLKIARRNQSHTRHRQRWQQHQTAASSRCVLPPLSAVNHHSSTKKNTRPAEPNVTGLVSKRSTHDVFLPIGISSPLLYLYLEAVPPQADKGHISLSKTKTTGVGQQASAAGQRGTLHGVFNETKLFQEKASFFLRSFRLGGGGGIRFPTAVGSSSRGGTQETKVSRFRGDKEGIPKKKSSSTRGGRHRRLHLRRFDPGEYRYRLVQGGPGFQRESTPPRLEGR